MAVEYLGTGNPDGVVMGRDAADLVGFHGKAPADQAAGITLATNATAGTVRTAVRSILTALTEKGLIASGP
ncbi:hypothetical protein FA04_14570 [Ensifer adhaerens]|uniref:Uncharacterized protein n=1 Tax=Ensifer adhaerens TaxID=106592 RepID=A0ABY8HE50_ENSAD|nr:hypothetical protein [Ensifer adhaerens]ANK73736.1 hypothetical protein FA04_14570 [Ensifer adhaerens]WFP89820.1 hypothetical protein P4B07_14800 [Ensifer adhaerens]